MGIAETFPLAFAKAMLGAGMQIPECGTVFVSVKDGDKPLILSAMRELREFGFDLVATSGTAAYLAGEGVEVERVNKVAQGRPHIVDRIKDGAIALVVNTTEGWQSHKDSASIRASAVAGNVPYFTTAAASVAAARAIGAMRGHALEVKPLQDYHSASE